MLKLDELVYGGTGVVGDSQNGLLHFVSNTHVAKVYSVVASHKHNIMGNRVYLSEDALVNGLRFYAHRTEGELRFALYEDGPEAGRLWQSNVVSVDAAPGWVTVPIANGTPATLDLAPGAYWLTWQTDTMAPVASYHAGEMGEGFRWRRPWGSYPEQISFGSESDIEINEENWAMYLVYNGDENWANQFPGGEGEGEAAGEPDGEGTVEGVDEGEASEGEGDGQAEGEYPPFEWPEHHDTDQNMDNRLSLSELLRVVQLFNAASLHCNELSEDGYDPGDGPQACRPHTADISTDWRISLSELLRCIQIFNAPGYFHCPEQDTEDQYCIGVE